MKSSISFEISSSRGWISGISTVSEVDLEVSLVPLSLVAHNAEYSLLSLEIFPTWLVMKSFNSLLFSLISSSSFFLACSTTFRWVSRSSFEIYPWPTTPAWDCAIADVLYSPDSIFLSNSRFFSRVSWVFLVICSL